MHAYSSNGSTRVLCVQYNSQIAEANENVSSASVYFASHVTFCCASVEGIAIALRISDGRDVDVVSPVRQRRKRFREISIQSAALR